MTMRRTLRVSGLAALAASILAFGSLAAGSPAALAAGCGSPVVVGTSCTLTGTLTLGGGSLSLTSPSSLTWAGTLTGSALSVVDTVAADQQLTVLDATGTGSGWHISTSATTFTTGSKTLGNTGTLVFTGSTSSITATTGPTGACVVVLTCTLPSDTTTYPVAITTAASAPPASTIYDTGSGTGVGAVLIGGSAAANPAGWWLNIPATTSAGTYTSTITMQIISGP
jgi:hypothetical protein